MVDVSSSFSSCLPTLAIFYFFMSCHPNSSEVNRVPFCKAIVISSHCSSIASNESDYGIDPSFGQRSVFSLILEVKQGWAGYQCFRPAESCSPMACGWRRAQMSCEGGPRLLLYLLRLKDAIKGPRRSPGGPDPLCVPCHILGSLSPLLSCS